VSLLKGVSVGLVDMSEGEFGLTGKARPSRPFKTRKAI
jgi:hypothetical protein